jgi:hypothetical protein
MYVSLFFCAAAAAARSDPGRLVSCADANTSLFVLSSRRPPGTAPPGPGPAQEMGIVPNGIDIHTRRISGLLTSSSYFPFAPFRPSLVPTFELPFSGGIVGPSPHL